MADPAAGRARRLRAGHRRNPLGARIRRTGLRRSRPQDRVARQGRRGKRRRPKIRQDAGSHRSALFPPHRGRSADRRRQQGAAEAGLEAENDVRRNSSRKWWRAISRSPGGRSPMARTPFELKGKTVFVAGHRGMVGAALVRRLAREDVELLTAGAQRARSARPGRGVGWFAGKRPQAVFLAAAKVGGIVANDTLRGEFLYDNLDHRGQCDPRRACQRRREADVSRLVLHLSQARAAADCARMRC